MQHDLRLACDTLYFGLVVDDFTFKDIFDEIKNYLFFPITLNLSHSRSKYYESEAVNEDEGFFCFFKPHSNLLNDYATFQFTGKFFRDIDHERVLKKIFKEYACFIRIQRIDVCLDVLWKELPLEVDDLTLCLGFPVPQYSPRWKNVRLPFQTYGRYNPGSFYLNMISCGKGDLVLRVYDKSLDIFEKYNKTYAEYYGYEEEIEKVFRIEYQMRGKSLKEFISNVQDLQIDISDLDKLCSCVISCLFYKFDFLYVDDFVDSFYIPTSCKRKSTLVNRIVYHKNKAGCHYFKYRDLQEEASRKIDEQNEKEQICNLHMRKIVKELENLKTVFDFDFDKAVREQYNKEISDIPF